ncbi:hypothetical protein LSAT2_018077 [Lamellibrachia satsuma]|nr:hypothetical protein LSAT2_018077 [Lamellibrachia satsuma]
MHGVTTPEPKRCGSEEFRCDDGQCIYWSWVCDGSPECRGGEDELHCHNDTKCGHGQFKCMFSEGCIPAARVCDGHDDCVDQTDEKDCHGQGTAPTIVCNLHQFYCGRDRCIDHAYVCDGVKDCLDGRDEKNCSIGGVPDSPWGVKASITKDNHFVNVTWHAPHAIHSTLRKYVIHFIDKSTKEEYEQHKVVHLGSPTSRDGQTLLGGLIPGDLYQIWVTVWTHQESKASNTVIIHFNKKMKCMKYRKLSSTSNEVTVGWEDTATDSAKLYVVTVASRQTLEFKTARVPAKKQGTKYSSTVKGLSPSVVYDVFVKRQDSDSRELTGPCTGNIHTVKTKGQPVAAPVIMHIDQYGDSTTLMVSWNRTKHAAANIECTLYYDYIEEHAIINSYQLQMKTKKIQHNTNKVLLSGLNACEEYFFFVQVTAPLHSVVSHRMVGSTGNSNKAPPKNVRVTAKPSKERSSASMTVTWDAPCDIIVIPLRYLIKVVEVKTSFVNGFRVPLTKDVSRLSSTVSNLERGATYHVSVSVDMSAPVYSKPVIITVAPYPAPADFKVIDMRNTSYLLTWDKVILPGHLIGAKYEIYHSSDMVDDQRAAKNFTRLANTTDLHYMTPAMHPGRDHTFKVRVPEVNGYPSDFSQQETVLTLKPDVAVHTSHHLGSKTLAAIIVPSLLVVLVLIVLLVVFVVRHIRLQNSFRSFANSHYDTRSGTATFSSGDDLGGYLCMWEITSFFEITNIGTRAFPLEFAPS